MRPPVKHILEFRFGIVYALFVIGCNTVIDFATEKSVAAFTAGNGVARDAVDELDAHKETTAEDVEVHEQTADAGENGESRITTSVREAAV